MHSIGWLNPKLYAKKVGAYWALRMSMATAAYAYASETMDDVSARMKVGNFIVPLGMSVKNRDGDLEHAYYTIPVEKNPITGALDTAMFGLIDILRGDP